MPAQIVNTVINVIASDAERKRATITVTLEDNDGVQEVITSGTINADASMDLNAHATEVGVQLLEGKKVEEEIEQESLTENNQDVLTIALNPKWSTSKRIIKRLIREMMRRKDPRFVIALEPVINYLQANYTAAQMASFLDITQPQVLQLNRRVNRILSDTGTVKALLAEFDVEEGEFD